MPLAALGLQLEFQRDLEWVTDARQTRLAAAHVCLEHMLQASATELVSHTEHDPESDANLWAQAVGLPMPRRLRATGGCSSAHVNVIARLLPPEGCELFKDADGIAGSTDAERTMPLLEGNTGADCHTATLIWSQLARST